MRNYLFTQLNIISENGTELLDIRWEFQELFCEVIDNHLLRHMKCSVQGADEPLEFYDSLEVTYTVS